MVALLQKISQWWASLRPDSGSEDVPPLSTRDIVTIDNLASVCLFLGPYRNLTTLTASMLFLHPDIQVLNHGWPRIIKNDELNFLSNYSREKFYKFVHHAIHMSYGGQRGSYGGSIMHAHAFADHPLMQEVFRKRYGRRGKRQTIRSLVWKESQVTTNILRENQASLRTMLDENPALRFLMPIRHPLDCAQSNIRTNTKKYLEGLESENLVDVVDTILEEFRWVFGLAEVYPDRFFIFFQDDFDRTTLEKLADFLNISRNEGWLADALKVWVMKEPYPVSEDVRIRYLELTARHFGDRPELQQRLAAFVITS